MPQDKDNGHPDRALTPRQLKFIEHYIEHGNATHAYRYAGYATEGMKETTVWRRAFDVLHNGKVQAKINETKLRAEQKIERTITLNKAYVLNGLVEIAETGLGRKKLRKSVITSEGKEVEVEALQPDRAVAARAFELMGKELSMFIDRKEIGGPGDFDRMNNDELDAFLAEQRGAIEHKRPDNQD